MRVFANYFHTCFFILNLSPMGEAHSVLPVSTWNFLFSHGSKVIQIFAFQIVHLVSTHQSCWQCFHSQHPGPKSVSLWDLPRIWVKSHLSKVSLRKQCIVGKFSTVRNEAFHMTLFFQLISVNNPTEHCLLDSQVLWAGASSFSFLPTQTCFSQKAKLQVCWFCLYAIAHKNWNFVVFSQFQTFVFFLC